MESLLKYKCYEVGYTELAFQKRDCSQEILPPKKVPLMKK